MIELRERKLLQGFQRDFPLVSRPFAVMARKLRSSETWVIDTLARFREDGRISRVGAVFRPGAVGASTLAAMAVPPARLESVARAVSAHPEVNHNYERDHALNLWFVATAEDESRLDAALASIRRETGVDPVVLPLVSEYHIDLGFDLDNKGRRHSKGAHPAATIPRLVLAGRDRSLVGRLQDGLALVERPFADLAQRAGWPGADGEGDVIARIAEWQRAGVIRRFGVVVHHRALGYVANAMCVWDVPDASADRIGRALAAEDGVSLAYRRARGGALWPYNIFCMMHGFSRSAVAMRIALINARHDLARFAHAVLFSRRAFKQQGARYVEIEESARG